MVLDEDIKQLYESEGVTFSNKAQLLNLQANRDFQRATLAVGSQANFDHDLKRSLYVSCFEKACDLRRQQMSTTTTITTQDKIIADVFVITKKLYDQALAGLLAV